MAGIEATVCALV